MPSESDNLRLPVVNHLTYSEAHAFINGYYAGARFGNHQSPRTDELHYWRAGYLAGTLSRYTLLYYAYKKLLDNE